MRIAEEIQTWMDRIDRMGKDWLVLILLSCTSCISMFQILTLGSGYAGLGKKKRFKHGWTG
jgi:hypothetical protein